VDRPTPLTRQTAEQERAVLPSAPLAMSNRAIWWELLAVLAIGVLPSLGIAIQILATPAGAPEPTWISSFSSFWSTTCSSIAVLYVISRSGEPWSAFGIVKPNYKDLALGLLLGWATFYIYRLVFRSLLSLLEGVDEMNPQAGEDRLGVIIMMAFSQFSNSFSEELVTRAYLITRLERLLHSRWLAIGVSASLFASYHLYYGSWAALLTIFTMGICYGCMYIALRRIWIVVIGHAVNNILLSTCTL